MLKDIEYTPPVLVTEPADQESDYDRISGPYLPEDSSLFGDTYSNSGVIDDVASRCSPSVASIVTDDEISRSSVGFRTPAPTVFEEDEEPEDEDTVDQKHFVAVATITTDPIRVRQELYDRYLYRADAWAEGLKHYFKKPLFRERTAGYMGMGSSSSHLGLRPKSGSMMLPPGGARDTGKWATQINGPKKRIMSAFPTTKVQYNVNTTTKTRRVNSAGYTLPRFH